MLLTDIVYPSLKQTTSFYGPRKIIFGEDSRKDLAGEIRRLEGSKLLIVTYPEANQSTFVEEIMSGLESEGIDFSVYSQTEPEPRIEIAEDLATYTRTGRFDLIIGIGGGSVMDLAKIASMSTANLKPVRDYLGVDLLPKKGAPLICIPTTAGTGSEVTMFSVLSVGKKKMDVVSPHILPDIALIDPLLTSTLPPQVTAGTGMDALSQAIETVTSLAATPLTDSLALTAIQLITKWLKVAYIDGNNIQARSGMALAATLSGLAFGSGKLTLGHSLAQTFGPVRKIPHGTSCGVALPYVMEFYLPVIPEKLSLIAAAMGLETQGATPQAGAAAIQAVMKLVEEIDVPVSLKELGFNKGELSELTETCVKEWPRPNSPRALTREAVLEVLERMWEGKILT
jgi:alcohol dehydrogenase class IV